MASQRSRRSISSGAVSSMAARARRVRLADQRGVLVIIARAAAKYKKVRIRYTKVTTGETVERVIEPYSYRYEPCSLGRGRWRFLYAYHGRHHTIEKYLVSNIIAAKSTTYSFVPRWTVEI